MKRISKRLLSCVLALLMVITSAPLTAFADDANLVSLKQAISEYENKMNGTVYTDMQPAYGAYVAAKESAYAYEYGGATGLNLKSVADTLASLTASMKPWTSYKGMATTSFGDDSTPADDPVYEGAYDGYIANLLYSSGVGKDGDKTTIAALEAKDESGNVITKLFYPTTVMLYDGETQPIVPVLATSELDVNKDYSVYSLYISENLSENKKSSLFDLKDELWTGANGRYDHNLNWPWTMKQTDGYPATYPDNSATKLQLSRFGVIYYQATMANAITYNGGDAGFAANEYYTVNNLNWRRFIGLNGPSDFMGMYGGAVPIYVVNYKALKTAVSSKSAYISSNLLSTLKDKSSFSYLLGAIDSATDYDPNESFNNDNNVSLNVAACANTIKQNVDAINNAACQLNAMSDYDTLSSAIETTKAVYEKNNSDGKYTAESFSAFKQDYETAVASAAAVASRGFTSTTSGTKLLNSYKALNVVAPSSGTSGDTSFTFDEESGVAVISGMGDMADYESGSESPFGENSSVTTVGISKDIKHIGANAFKGASGLKTITVPAEATYGDGAFDGCTSLATVIITGGEVKNTSADNAPWQQPSVKLIELGENESDFSVVSVGDDVFTDCRNAVFYIYNTNCDIPSESSATFGINPTFYGWTPSTAKSYADKFGYKFVSLGHEHTLDGGTVVKPGCLTGGYTVFKCLYCDETVKRKPVSALGHNYDNVEVIPPSCTEQGYKLSTCSSCGNTKKTEYVNALGHTYNGDVKYDYPDGEIRAAETVYKHTIGCSVCSKSSVSEFCSFKVDSYKTLGTDNYVVFKCSVCGGTYLYKNDAASGEHMVFFFDADKQLKAAQRVADGAKPVSVPEMPQAAQGHSFAWTLDNVEVNPADTVIISDTVFTLVDKVEEYNVTYYNASGNPIKTEKVAYGSAPFAVPALPDGAINDDDGGHKLCKWDVDPSTAVITADTSFTQVYVLVEHNFNDTVLIPVTCTSNGEMSRFCEECGYHIENEVIYAKGHTPETDKAVSATCTTAGKTAGSHCSVCKTVFEAQKPIAALGHKWNSGVVTKEATIDKTGIKTYTCKVCKEPRTEVIPKLSIKDITPSDAAANKAPVNKSIKKPSGITTVSKAKKKQLIISFKPVSGAQNYRVMYRKAGAKKWNYAWTDGKTSYTLKKLKNKGMYEFCFAAYQKNAKGEWERGNYSKTSYRYYYKAKIKKAKAKKKAIAVSWEKDKSATGYELYYSTKSNMKGAKKVVINGSGKTSYKISNLKSKKKYYVRVRAIKKYKGKNYIGEYSAKKKVKVK